MSDLGSGDEGMPGQRYQQGAESGGADFDSALRVAIHGEHGEQELATKMLQIQSKRFYLDVKQNRRGRFIKVAEIGADGRRSQIFLALSTAAEFRDHLSSFSDYYASLGPPNPEHVPEDGKLRSEIMIKDNRRYYLDLKENSRGRFLRVSQTITRGGPRSQIAIPAQGMIEFRDALTDLLDEFGTDDGGFRGELPEGRHLRVENKNFYFDIGQNTRGIYMRISEVKSNFRTAITLPEKSWVRFRDILVDYCDKIKQAEQGQGSGGNQPTPVGQNSSAGGSGQQRNKSQVLDRSRSSSSKSVRKTRTNYHRYAPSNIKFQKRRSKDYKAYRSSSSDPRKTQSAPINKRAQVKTTTLAPNKELSKAQSGKSVAFQSSMGELIEEKLKASDGENNLHVANDQFVEIRKKNETRCSSSSTLSITPKSSVTKVNSGEENQNMLPTYSSSSEENSSIVPQSG